MPYEFTEWGDEPEPQKSSARSGMGAASADDAYFPIRTNPGGVGLTALESKWFGKPLQRMGEPRLPDLAKNVNADVYRLMILPTWRNSIAVRAERHEDIYSLSARRLDGLAGYDPGELVEAKDIELTAEDSNSLALLIQNLDFFRLPIDDDVRGWDGTEWIIEGVSQGKYHIAHRWGAEYGTTKRKLTAFLAFCKFLLDKSTLSERTKNKGAKLVWPRSQGAPVHIQRLIEALKRDADQLKEDTELGWFAD